MSYVVGVSAYYHDSAAALIDEKGAIVAAVHEERFTRKKHDSSFPLESLRFFKSEFHLSPEDIDAVVFYEKPVRKFFRTVESILAGVPHSFTLFKSYMTALGTRERGLKQQLIDSLHEIWPDASWDEKIRFSSHHLSHAASAFYTSPFSEAAILTVDGVGEYDTATIMKGDQSGIQPIASMSYPNSLGILYSAFTAYCGMTPNSGEYKLMGLAPFGKPVHRELILSKLVEIDKDGKDVRVNPRIINPDIPIEKTLSTLEQLFGVPRAVTDQLDQRYADIAASIQSVLGDAMLVLAERAHHETGSENLLLAGGVALNCVANSYIAEHGPFSNVWVFPASGDAGGALGAALAYVGTNVDKEEGSWFNPYLGRQFSADRVALELEACGAVYKDLGSDMSGCWATMAKLLKENGAGGILIGRSEFGPRALGARSIVGLASDTTAQVRLNLKTKFRESFRPFAPMLFTEDFDTYFDKPEKAEVSTDYMLFTFPVREDIRASGSDDSSGDLGERISKVRSSLPAITHVDYSARVQTLSENSPAAIKDFYRGLKSAVGEDVFINTSFNVRGEPIVDSPTDAFSAFMRTDLDFLYIDGFLLLKSEQTAQRDAFLIEFEPD